MRGMGILEAQVYGYMDCPWIVMETNKTEHIYLNGFSGDVFLNFDPDLFEHWDLFNQLRAELSLHLP